MSCEQKFCWRCKRYTPHFDDWDGRNGHHCVHCVKSEKTKEIEKDAMLKRFKAFLKLQDTPTLLELGDVFRDVVDERVERESLIYEDEKFSEMMLKSLGKKKGGS